MSNMFKADADKIYLQMPNTQSFTHTDIDGKILPLVTDGKYKTKVGNTEFESALLDGKPVVIYINPMDKTKYVVYTQYDFTDQETFEAAASEIYFYRW